MGRSSARTLFAVLLLGIAGGASGQDEPWLQGPAFSTPAAELRRAALALPELDSADSEILLHETSVLFDAAGRSTVTTRVIYRVLTASGTESGSAVRQVWAPWREKRPVVRARVVSAQGVAHELDPGALSDAPFGTADRNVFSDLRVLEGPLPAVSVGSIVEKETVSVEETPLFEAGTVSSLWVGGSVPVRRARIRIEAPVSVPLRVASRPQGAFASTEEEVDGTRRVTLEMGAFAPPAEVEPFLPPELVQAPVVSVSTGDSWSSVAAGYAALVDGQITGSDLGALARKLTARAKSRPEKILALVRHLHETVRYTGVEYSWSGIVPEKPRVTLGRKYGDCKDKSALLVALLREAGIPAHLALLETGFGPDVEPDLPGLGRFDHAIVRVDGDPAVWVDATSEHASPGSLPIGVEGRLALIVREGSSALERIPEAVAPAHHTAEIREFFLAEEGLARVVETTAASGRFGSGYRSGHASRGEKEIREQLEGYAESTYGAAKLDHYRASHLHELDEPFELRLEMSGATVGSSSGADIRVPVPLHLLAGELAGAVPPRAPRTEAKSEQIDEDDPLRRGDFYFFSPYVTEWTYRIHPPPGFSPLALPERLQRTLGAATLVSEFRLAGDGTVLVEARFDSGPRRWTAEQYEEGRRAMHELQRDSPWIVSFEQQGEAHLRAGRLREAIAEFRRLAVLHPQEALHHSQIAAVLLAAGFGSAARREARLAVELEPGNAAAQQKLGLVLLNDPLGREFRTGADLAGAEAALRKAKELDPKNIPARALLALVLEHDADGLRWGTPSTLGKAIGEYQALRAAVGDTTVDVDYLHCLGHAGRMQELREAAPQVPESLDRNKLLVAAVAATSGTAAARSEAGRWTARLQDRQELLLGAGFVLVGYRRYPEAVALLEDGMRDSQAAAKARPFLDVLGRARRHEEISLDLSKPGEFVLAFLAPMLSVRPSATARLREFLSPHLGDGEEEVLEGMSAARAVLGELPPGLFTADGVSDIVIAALEPEIVPIGSLGYEVRLHDRGQTQSGSLDLAVARRSDGKLEIVGAMPELHAIGHLAEELLGRDDGENARRWLSYAREKLPPAAAEEPLGSHPLVTVWTPADPDLPALRVAALALQVRPDGPPDRLPEAIGALREGTPEEARWKLDYLLALVHAYRHDVEAIAPARRLLERFPRSVRARSLLVGCLLALGRVDEAEAEAEPWLAEEATRRDGLRTLVTAAQKRGDMAEAARRFDRLQEAGGLEAVDLNNQAWFLLEHGRAAEALPLAERSLRQQGSDSTLHTLASIYAELGDLAQARATIFRKIEQFSGGHAEPLDSLVFGRMAEHLGEAEVAIEIYREALPRMDDDETRRMVERRLQALEGSPRGKKGRT